MSYQLLNSDQVIAESAIEITYSEHDKGWKGDTWIITDQEKNFTPKQSFESLAIEIRASRNQKLKESDFSQLSDSPVDKAAWAAYRQALRDLTRQSGFPWEITWPEKP